MVGCRIFDINPRESCMIRVVSRVINRSLLATLLAPILTAATAQARTFVVPSPPISEEAAAVFETRVAAHNATDRTLEVERHLLPGAAATGATAKARLALPAGRTIPIATPPSFRGLLQLSGETGMEIRARLVARGAAEESGVDLPVIGSDNLFHAGETARLAGLVSTDATFTNLALVNLAGRAGRCAVTLSAAGGAPLGPTLTVMVGALSNLPFLHAFEGRSGPEGLAEASASVSCDQDFYAYAVLADSQTGRYGVVTPVAGAGAPLEGKTAPLCPTGATCFDADGIVHVPTPPPGLPVGRVSFPAPSGVAKRLRLSLDVTVADWYPQQPSGKALIYWFVVAKNPDMPGLLYFRGPGKDEAFARHGMNLKHPEKIKIIVPFAAQIGHTYHVDNDYDMAGRTYTITITDSATGAVAAKLQGKPNVSSFTIKPALKFLVDMGFYPGKVPTEVPSYGWKYANVHVEAYMH
jgi:hypothetical protein